VPKPPPLDSELAAYLPPRRFPLIPDQIPAVRSMLLTDPGTVLGGRPIAYADHVVPGTPAVTVTVFERDDRRPGGPAICFLHGGGLIFGDRWFGLGPVIDWVTDLDALLVSVEYRLAPEHPYPGPLDDCVTALAWLADQAGRFRVDPARLVLAGASAGGGLAAAAALRIRDRGGPRLAGQMLIYPMLDDRNDTVSSLQIDGFGRWDRGSNDVGWDAYLGSRRITGPVDTYAAPARATDLSGLPPTFIDVTSAEVFRDECVAYASRLWADGGDGELHVWPGGFHACDMSAPDATVSRAMIAARAAWLSRLWSR
jgi:acetyl esterase/lipase